MTPKLILVAQVFLAVIFSWWKWKWKFRVNVDFHPKSFRHARCKSLKLLLQNSARKKIKVRCSTSAHFSLVPELWFDRCRGKNIWNDEEISPEVLATITSLLLDFFSSNFTFFINVCKNWKKNLLPQCRPAFAFLAKLKILRFCRTVWEVSRNFCLILTKFFRIFNVFPLVFPKVLSISHEDNCLPCHFIHCGNAFTVSLSWGVILLRDKIMISRQQWYFWLKKLHFSFTCTLCIRIVSTNTPLSLLINAHWWWTNAYWWWINTRINARADNSCFQTACYHQTRDQGAGKPPQKFSKTCLVVRNNSKLQSFCFPRK